MIRNSNTTLDKLVTGCVNPLSWDDWVFQGPFFTKYELPNMRNRVLNNISNITVLYSSNYSIFTRLAEPIVTDRVNPILF